MLPFVIGILVFLGDYWTKDLIKGVMVPNQSIPVLDGILYLTYVRNPGAAFGMLAHRTGFFIGLGLIVIGLLLVYSWRSAAAYPRLQMALGLQLGGAMGNFVDRLKDGYVIDYIDFRFWPVFNLADIAIVVGVIWFFIEVSRMYRPQSDRAGHE